MSESTRRILRALRGRRCTACTIERARSRIELLDAVADRTSTGDARGVWALSEAIALSAAIERLQHEWEQSIDPAVRAMTWLQFLGTRPTFTDGTTRAG